ncbi:MAG: glycosyltransferase family 87 protein [Pseudomonadota bacterium]
MRQQTKPSVAMSEDGIGSPVSRTVAVAMLGVCLIALCGFGSTVANVPTVDQFVLAAVAQAVPFLLAAVLVWQLPAHAARGLTLLIVILAVTIVLRLIGFATPHDGLTTDAYRYVWDGRIQWAGFNPYLHIPASDPLASLRDEAVYPFINQKERAVTVYPPFAQVLFALGNRISDSVTGIKIVMAVADLLVIVGIMMWLGHRGLPRERVVVYAWHPLPIWELTSQAHIDAAAMAVLVFALWAADRDRRILAGALFAAAVLTKYFPAAFIPAVWRRWDWKLPAAGLAVTALLVLPYYLAGSPDLSGYLGKHLDNEGYGAGWGFHPIWLLRDFSLADPPARLWIAASAVLLLGLALLAFLRLPPASQADDRPLDVALMIWIAAAFIWTTSPHYPWYFCWVIPLMCLHMNPGVLAMTVLAPLLYWPRPPGGPTWTELYAIVFYLPLVVALIGWVWNRNRALTADLSFRQAQP